MLAKKLGTKLGFGIPVYFSLSAPVCSLGDGEHWMSVVTLELQLERNSKELCIHSKCMNVNIIALNI